MSISEPQGKEAKAEEQQRTIAAEQVLSASAIGLLIQVALPCCVFGSAPIRLTLGGGTNAENAPQIDYLIKVRFSSLDSFLFFEFVFLSVLSSRFSIRLRNGWESIVTSMWRKGLFFFFFFFLNRNWIPRTNLLSLFFQRVLSSRNGSCGTTCGTCSPAAAHCNDRSRCRHCSAIARVCCRPSSCACTTKQEDCFFILIVFLKDRLFNCVLVIGYGSNVEGSTSHLPERVWW